MTKAFLILITFLVLPCTSVSTGHAAFYDVANLNISFSNSINVPTPFSNIKVYKRWDEGDISWVAWFRQGALYVIALLFTLFGVILLLSMFAWRQRRHIKENYQDIWEAEENYYRLLEIVNDAVIVIDPSGDKILSANICAETLTGYARFDLFNMNIFSLAKEGCLEDVSNLLETIRNEDFMVNSNVSIITKDKRELHVAVKGRLIKSYNKTVILLTFSELS
ncbi:PAS domain S-box protein [Thermodesulfobacteriota bacterium]